MQSEGHGRRRDHVGHSASGSGGFGGEVGGSGPEREETKGRVASPRAEEEGVGKGGEVEEDDGDGEGEEAES